MFLRNRNFSANSFFISSDFSHVVQDWHELARCQLSSAIYYSPSAFPVANKLNWRDHSCFEGYLVPTASYVAEIDKHNQVTRFEKINDKISLDSLIQHAIEHITNSIKTIYQQHATVNLLFGSGIDSLVIAAAIKKLGLLPRTRIISVLYNIHNHPTALVNSPTARAAVNAFAENHKHQLLGVDYVSLDDNDLVNGFNTLELAQFKCHMSTAVSLRYPSSAIVSGIFGNETLIHHDMHIDELRKQNPLVDTQLHQLQQNPPDVYAWTLVDSSWYNLKTTYYSIHDQSMCNNKPLWAADLNGCKFYYPLASEQMIHNARFLDYSSITLDDILHARVAKQVLEHFASNEFNQYIVTETPLDGEHTPASTVALDKVNTNLLYLPKNLRHSPDGYAYLKNEIAAATENNCIAVNTLVAIKTLQHLSNLTGHRKSK